jgi:hypothetical protein
VLGIGLAMTSAADYFFGSQILVSIMEQVPDHRLHRRRPDRLDSRRDGVNSDPKIGHYVVVYVAPLGSCRRLLPRRWSPTAYMDAAESASGRRPPIPSSEDNGGN